MSCQLRGVLKLGVVIEALFFPLFIFFTKMEVLRKTEQ
jgi:hypothetical protein